MNDPRVISRYIKYVVPSDDPDECWGWSKSTTKTGYAQLGYNTAEGKFKNVYMHRVAYELFNGESPGDKFVCHSCDNPICTNPRHLWLGSCKDNVHDAIAKGRIQAAIQDASRNRRIQKRKLYREFRNACLASPKQINAFAKHFGLNAQTRDKWKKKFRYKLTPQGPFGNSSYKRAAEMRKYPHLLYYYKGSELAEIFGVHPNTARAFKNSLI